MKRVINHIILVLSIIGIILSSYLTYVHYSGTDLDYCHFNESFDCDLVNKSSYAEFLGIPVALGGLIMYLILLYYVLGEEYNLKLHKIKDFKFYIKLISTLGVLFTLYLMYIEAFVLESWCIFCIIHAAIIFIIFALLMRD